MTPDPGHGWREHLGAYLTGRSTDPERAGLEAHLEGCASCRHELEELAPVARALDAADPDRILSGAEEPPAALAPRIAERIAEARRRRRRRGVIVAIAATVGVAAIMTAALVIPRNGPEGERVTLVASAPGAGGWASLAERPWGTEVHLRAAGLAPGATYVVWLESIEGDRVQGGTFTAPDDNEVRMTLAVALARNRSVLLGITETGGDTVLRARLPADR